MTFGARVQHAQLGLCYPPIGYFASPFSFALELCLAIEKKDACGESDCMGII